MFLSNGSFPLYAVHSLVCLSCLLSRQVSNNSPHQLHIGPRDCYLSVIKLLEEALLTAAEENVKHLNDLVNLTQAETYASVNSGVKQEFVLAAHVQLVKKYFIISL